MFLVGGIDDHPTINNEYFESLCYSRIVTGLK
jgi:hypothetical protein